MLAPHNKESSIAFFSNPFLRLVNVIYNLYYIDTVLSLSSVSLSIFIFFLPTTDANKNLLIYCILKSYLVIYD